MPFAFLKWKPNAQTDSVKRTKSVFTLSDELQIKVGAQADGQISREVLNLVQEGNPAEREGRQLGLTIIAESLRILRGRPKSFLLRKAAPKELHAVSISPHFLDAEGIFAAYYFFETFGYRFTIIMVGTRENKSLLSVGLVLDFQKISDMSTALNTAVSLQSAETARLSFPQPGA
jgi:hypothetical protein